MVRKSKNKSSSKSTGSTSSSTGSIPTGTLVVTPSRVPSMAVVPTPSTGAIPKKPTVVPSTTTNYCAWLTVSEKFVVLQFSGFDYKSDFRGLYNGGLTLKCPFEDANKEAFDKLKSSLPPGLPVLIYPNLLSACDKNAIIPFDKEKADLVKGLLNRNCEDEDQLTYLQINQTIIDYVLDLKFPIPEYGHFQKLVNLLPTPRNIVSGLLMQSDFASAQAFSLQVKCTLPNTEFQEIFSCSICGDRATGMCISCDARLCVTCNHPNFHAHEEKYYYHQSLIFPKVNDNVPVHRLPEYDDDFNIEPCDTVKQMFPDDFPEVTEMTFPHESTKDTDTEPSEILELPKVDLKKQCYICLKTDITLSCNSCMYLFCSSECYSRFHAHSSRISHNAVFVDLPTAIANVSPPVKDAYKLTVVDDIDQPPSKPSLSLKDKLVAMENVVLIEDSKNDSDVSDSTKQLLDADCLTNKEKVAAIKESKLRAKINSSEIIKVNIVVAGGSTYEMFLSALDTVSSLKDSLCRELNVLPDRMCLRINQRPPDLESLLCEHIIEEELTVNVLIHYGIASPPKSVVSSTGDFNEALTSISLDDILPPKRSQDELHIREIEDCLSCKENRFSRCVTCAHTLCYVHHKIHISKYPEHENHAMPKEDPTPVSKLHTTIVNLQEAVKTFKFLPILNSFHTIFTAKDIPSRLAAVYAICHSLDIDPLQELVLVCSSESDLILRMKLLWARVASNDVKIDDLLKQSNPVPPNLTFVDVVNGNFPQAGEWATADYIRIATMAAMFILSLVGFKGITSTMFGSEFVKTVNGCGALVRNLRSCWTGMADATDAVLNEVYSWLGYDYLEHRNSAVRVFSDRIEKLKDDLIALEGDCENELMHVLCGYDRLKCCTDELKKLRKEYALLTIDKSCVHGVSKRLNQCEDLIDKLRKVIKSVEQVGNGKPEPTVITFVGSPGVGKSYSQNTLGQKLQDKLHGSVYTRSCMDKFWSGYNGQSIVNMPELGMHKDYRDMEEFFRAATSDAFPLNMADTVDKGQFFNGLAIIATSNMLYLTGGQTFPIYDRVALNRRRGLVVLVQNAHAEAYLDTHGETMPPDDKRWGETTYTLLHPTWGSTHCPDDSYPEPDANLPWVGRNVTMQEIVDHAINSIYQNVQQYVKRTGPGKLPISKVQFPDKTKILGFQPRSQCPNPGPFVVYHRRGLKQAPPQVFQPRPNYNHNNRRGRGGAAGGGSARRARSRSSSPDSNDNAGIMNRAVRPLPNPGQSVIVPVRPGGPQPQGALMLQTISKSHMYPIIIMGQSGLGKTYCLRQIQAAASSQYCEITTSTDLSKLSGDKLLILDDVTFDYETFQLMKTLMRQAHEGTFQFQGLLLTLNSDSQLWRDLPPDEKNSILRRSHVCELSISSVWLLKHPMMKFQYHTNYAAFIKSLPHSDRAQAITTTISIRDAEQLDISPHLYYDYSSIANLVIENMNAKARDDIVAYNEFSLPMPRNPDFVVSCPLNYRELTIKKVIENATKMKGVKFVNGAPVSVGYVEIVKIVKSVAGAFKDAQSGYHPSPGRYVKKFNEMQIPSQMDLLAVLKFLDTSFGMISKVGEPIVLFVVENSCDRLKISDNAIEIDGVEYPMVSEYQKTALKAYKRYMGEAKEIVFSLKEKLDVQKQLFLGTPLATWTRALAAGLGLMASLTAAGCFIYGMVSGFSFSTPEKSEEISKEIIGLKKPTVPIVPKTSLEIVEVEDDFEDLEEERSRGNRGKNKGERHKDPAYKDYDKIADKYGERVAKSFKRTYGLDGVMYGVIDSYGLDALKELGYFAQGDYNDPSDLRIYSLESNEKNLMDSPTSKLAQQRQRQRVAQKVLSTIVDAPTGPVFGDNKKKLWKPFQELMMAKSEELGDVIVGVREDGSCRIYFFEKDSVARFSMMDVEDPTSYKMVPNIKGGEWSVDFDRYLSLCVPVYDDDILFTLLLYIFSHGTKIVNRANEEVVLGTDYSTWFDRIKSDKPIPEGMLNPSLMDRAAKVGNNIVMLYNDTHFECCATMIRGNYGLTVDHAPFDRVKVDNKDYRVKVIARDELHDLCCFEITDKTWQARANIEHLLATDADLDKVRDLGKFGALFCINRPKTGHVMVVCEASLDSVEVPVDGKVTNTTYYANFGTRMTGVSLPGDCGCPILADTLDRPIISIHARGSSSSSHGTLITREIFQKLVSKTQCCQNVPYEDPQFMEVHLGEDYGLKRIGFPVVNGRAIQINVPTKTNEYRTPVDFDEIFHEPTIKSISDPRNEKGIDFAARSLKKYQTPSPTLEGGQLSDLIDACNDISKEWTAAMRARGKKLRVLTDSEVVSGVHRQYLPHSKGMDLTGSVGYPYNVLFPNKTKKGDYLVMLPKIDDLNKYEIQNNDHGNYFREDLRRCEGLMAKGIRPEWYFTAFVKDEVLPISKVRAKTRTFMCGPFTMFFLQRKYFGTFTWLLEECTSEISPQIGLDVNSPVEWRNFLMDLMKIGFIELDLDSKNHDASIHEIIDIHWRLFVMYGSKAMFQGWTKAIENKIQVLLDSCSIPAVVFRDIVIMLANGKITSGEWFTSWRGSYANSVAMRYVFIRLSRIHWGIPLTYQEQKENFCHKNYSDDSANTVNNDVAKFFTPDNIASVALELGHVIYCDGGMKSIDKLCFLQRKIAKIDSDYVAQIAGPTMLRRLTWIKSKPPYWPDENLNWERISNANHLEAAWETLWDDFLPYGKRIYHLVSRYVETHWSGRLKHQIPSFEQVLERNGYKRDATVHTNKLTRDLTNIKDLIKFQSSSLKMSTVATNADVGGGEVALPVQDGTDNTDSAKEMIASTGGLLTVEELTRRHWIAQAPVLVETNTPAGTILGVWPIHPSQIDAFTQVALAQHDVWEGTHAMKITPTSNVYCIGGMSLAYFPPWYTEEEIRAFNLTQLSVSQHWEINIQQPTAVSVNGHDVNQLRFRMNTPLDTNDQNSFNGWYVLFVHSRFTTSGVDTTTLEIGIATCSDYLFSQPKIGFSLDTLTLVGANRSGILNSSATSLFSIGCDDAAASVYRTIVIHQDSVTALFNCAVKSIAPGGGWTLDNASASSNSSTFVDFARSVRNVINGVVGQCKAGDNYGCATRQGDSTLAWNTNWRVAMKYQTIKSPDTLEVVLPDLCEVSEQKNGSSPCLAFHYDLADTTSDFATSAGKTTIGFQDTCEPITEFVIQPSAVYNDVDTAFICSTTAAAMDESLVTFQDLLYNSISVQTQLMGNDMRNATVIANSQSQVYSLRAFPAGTIITYLRLNPNGIWTAPSTPTDIVIPVPSTGWIQLVYEYDYPVTTPLPEWTNMDQARSYSYNVHKYRKFKPSELDRAYGLLQDIFRKSFRKGGGYKWGKF
ncbi:hypothetical protein 1 [Hubei picorna-like virus 67]|uniref:hypothetical protein 1 n=1 Tax=Hubei picorna-like virus 67 TaxID=1923150 RepID=UPI000909FBBD|nr:hypothetical protein 1 [Hubei picorna-like virus 67]APG78378.1 hypothetical protein 1 [Hubei picorna-like virus 67]